MVFKNELYPIHFYGRVRGECDGRLQNWPGIVNERPKFLAMSQSQCYNGVTINSMTNIMIYNMNQCRGA